jgi:hypothetical protein
MRLIENKEPESRTYNKVFILLENRIFSPYYSCYSILCKQDINMFPSITSNILLSNINNDINR